jgi:hypothetical protein
LRPRGRGRWDGFWDECGKSFGILVKEFEGEWNVKIEMDKSKARESNAKAAIGYERGIRLPKSLHIRPTSKAGDDHA